MSHTLFPLISLALAALAYSQPVHAQDVTYDTTCVIEGGLAKSYISVTTPGTLSLSGQILTYLYDRNNQRILEHASMASVTTRGRGLFEIASQPVSSLVAGCAVKVSGAITTHMSKTPHSTYMTSCVIENGHARSYMQLSQGTDLSFRGRVTFKHFNRNGDYRYQDITTANFSITGNERHLVAERPTRQEAAYCVFDASEAIQ